MISSDNEQSRSRSTDGIIAKMYNVLTTKVFVRYKTSPFTLNFYLVPLTPTSLVPLTQAHHTHLTSTPHTSTPHPPHYPSHKHTTPTYTPCPHQHSQPLHGTKPGPLRTEQRRSYQGPHPLEARKRACPTPVEGGGGAETGVKHTGYYECISQLRS